MSTPIQRQKKKLANQSTEIEAKGAPAPRIPANGPEKFTAVAQQVAKIEATFLGLLRSLRANRPDLAPALEKEEKGYLAAQAAISRKSSSSASQDIATQALTEKRSLERCSEEREMKSESNGSLELLEAAAPTLHEITRLSVAAPPRIAAMLIYIRDHLFDPDLSVHRIKEACHLRDNSIALHFHRVLGRPPGTFITDSRLAVAERLLSRPWMPIWKITELLGYSSIQVFSRAYFRRKGRRPSTFRKEAPIDPAPAAMPPVPAPPLAPQEADLLQRALAGSLEDHEAAHLVCRLLEIYPPHRRSAPCSP